MLHAIRMIFGNYCRNNVQKSVRRLKQERLMMMTHELKLNIKYCDSVYDSEKTFDVRMAKTFDGANLTWRQSHPKRACGLFDGDGVLQGVIMPYGLPKQQEARDDV